MFYTLSKALLFLIQPTIWLLVLVVLGFRTRSRIKRKRYVWSAVFLFMIMGNSFLYEQVIEGMEWSPQKKAHHEVGILLGGYGEYNSQHEGLEFFRTADRLTETAALYHEGLLEKILISSGVHEEGHPEWNESKISKDYLMRIGIPDKDILVEDRSWNTYQNALESKRLLDSLGFSSTPMLITSAFHMKRAMACFKKQGLECVPYPVDYIYDEEPGSFFSYLVPSLGIMMAWQIPIKEWVGMQVYRLKGYL